MISRQRESDKDMADDIIINDNITVPAAELSYTASRASGPGGQHVNTTDSRIQLRWNLDESVAFTDGQKNWLRKALGPRLTESGDLILASDALCDACSRCWIDDAPRRLERPSDHTPVVAEFGI